MAEQALLFDGKKFMWDGKEYESDKETAPIRKEYEDNGFGVEVHKEGSKTYLYTRRIVTEVVVD
ncbi:MAG: hypothetical protein ACYS8Z_03635 [Planctomycetota bacterium]|jgi:hypothetical protein